MKKDIFIACETFPEGAVAGFSTRLGGVSGGMYESMNPDPRRGEDPKNVIENCRRLGEAAGFASEDMVMIEQVHGDAIVKAGVADRGTGLFSPIVNRADALVTDEPGVALTIFTADCVPILMYDPVRRAIAAVHAGWRGTAMDIAGKTVARMREEYGCRPRDIYAAIGPCISRCCFETDGEVPRAMRDALGDEADAAVERRGEKYHVDLKKINELLLRRAGAEHIEISGRCTACETELFWSHRKMGLARGSNASVIMLR